MTHTEKQKHKTTHHDAPELDSPENFFNRELSWLKFNKRVLDEAGVKDTPLLERLKFVAIASSNLDEFFMIRIAGLKQQQGSGLTRPDITGMSVSEQLSAISKGAHKLVKKEYSYLKNLIAEMKNQGISFHKVSEFNDNEHNNEKIWIEKYFHNTIFPVVTPLAVDAGHPFPFLANLTLNLAVTLSRKCEKDSASTQHSAVIQIPSVLPRIIELPSVNGSESIDKNNVPRRFIFLEDIIEHYCAHFFHGYTIENVFSFRITRNSDLDISEEEAQDLLAEVEKSLRQRNRGKAVRLEIGKNQNKKLLKFMMNTLDIEETDIYEIPEPGYLDTTCFLKFIDSPGFEHLLHKPFIPQPPQALTAEEATADIFAIIRKQDLLIHHPYESFDPVIDFVRQAASDPNVLAIKQTLYRVSGSSPIVRALAEAAQNSKQVTVLVELKARFDEENNILWARRLEEAGCHVIYGLIGLKTHAKMVLVVRREYNGIKRYVHMGTGNYNDATAKVYTDFSFFTANDQFGADASAFFNVLSGYSDPPVWNKIAVAPIGLREKIKNLIDKEIEYALAGKGGRIIAKMNSLLDKDIILKLYEASCAGVKVNLIVRGICSLRPGVSNVSENIIVRSIIGQFLEHHRVFYFANNSEEETKEKIFLSSADWMSRNFNARVELLFPLEDPKHVKRVKNILELMLADNQKAYIMKEDGAYCRAKKRGKSFNSQLYFYQQIQKIAQAGIPSPEKILQPFSRKS